jgi:hypothetical protein
MDADLAFKLARLRSQIAELGSSNCRRPEWMARASKVGDEEGHAQHQRDANNDDEDKESAHPYSSMRQEAPISIVGRTFFWCLLSRVDVAFSETSLAGCRKQHDHPAS